MAPESASELQQRKDRFAATLAKLSRSPNAVGAQSSQANSPSQGPLSGADIVDGLYDSGVKVFTDVGGEAWFLWKNLPESMRDSDDEKKSRHCQFECLLPVPSRKLRSFLNAWIYVEEIGQLKPGALNEAVSILEGLAFMNRQPCDLETAIDINPVLESLLALLETEPHWEGTASDLLAELQYLSREREWNFESQPHWPKNPSQLSRSVGTLHDLLKDAGIAHEYRRCGNRRCHWFALETVSMNLKGTQEQGGEGARATQATIAASSAPGCSATGVALPREASTQIAAHPVTDVTPVEKQPGPAAREVTSDTSDGVLTPAPSPSPELSAAKFIAHERSVRSDGSDGDFRASRLEVASPARPTDWRRVVKKGKGVGGKRSGILQPAAPP